MNAKKLAGLSTLAVVFVVSGCATITMTKQGTATISSDPTFEESQTYFLGGLVGENEIDVKKVCNGGEATQMQSQTTFVNGLLGGLTLGIYTPRTAKVWCDKEKV